MNDSGKKIQSDFKTYKLVTLTYTSEPGRFFSFKIRCCLTRVQTFFFFFLGIFDRTRFLAQRLHSLRPYCPNNAFNISEKTIKTLYCFPPSDVITTTTINFIYRTVRSPLNNRTRNRTARRRVHGAIGRVYLWTHAR